MVVVSHTSFVHIKPMPSYTVHDLLLNEDHSFTTFNVAWAFAQTLSSYSMKFTITPPPTNQVLRKTESLLHSAKRCG